MKLLHKYGADINLKGFGRDTPLHDAARNGQIKVSNNGLSEKVPMNYSNISGEKQIVLKIKI